MKRLMILASLAAGLAAQAANAAEVTFFAGPNFSGQQVTIRGGSNDFVGLGFNDRASSMIVRSGSWEVCEHRDFGGACAVFGRGEYPNLGRFNNIISSAREVEGGGGGYRDDERREWRERERDREREREEWRDRRDRDGNWQGGYHNGNGWQGGGYQGGAAVELFDGDNFSGRAIGISGDIRTLTDVGFNDHANSMVIHEGTWELCEHADYRGQCQVFGPGQYNLRNLRDRLSSLRRVR